MTAPLPDDLLVSWDKVSAAIDAIVLAQPAQMTAASERLRLAQAEHFNLIKKLSR
jgi:hypothetical protein